jgi:hypothetical protein
MTIFFADVSHWDKDNGRQIPAGDQLVIAKATHGTAFTDSAYQYHRGVAQSRGMFFAAYHWLNHGNAAGQARYCWSVVGRTPLMVDAEDVKGNTGFDGFLTVEDIREFVTEFRRLGGVCNLVYLPHWYWENDMGSPDLSSLVRLGVGLASSNYRAYSDDGAGWIPYGGYRSVTHWQYTSSPMDRNAYRGTLADYIKTVSKGQTDVELTDPVPATGQNVGVVLSDIWNMIMRGHSGFVPTDVHYIGQQLNALRASAAADEARDAATLAVINAQADVIKAGGGDVNVTAVLAAVDDAVKDVRSTIEQVHAAEMAALRQVHAAELAGLQAELDALKAPTA